MREDPQKNKQCSRNFQKFKKMIDLFIFKLLTKGLLRPHVPGPCKDSLDLSTGIRQNKKKEH